MKIYFAGSIRGGRDDQELYFSLIAELQKYGKVLTEHLGHKSLSSLGETNLTDKEIFERDMAWIKEADIVIAEVTTPSLGVGYELGQAQAMGKPIHALYRQVEGKRISAMIAGNEYIKVSVYKDFEEIQKIFELIFRPE